MKSLRTISTWTFSLITGLLLLLFAAGCSKHDDDCAKPSTASNGGTVSTRSASANAHDLQASGTERAGLQQRGLEDDQNGSGGDGISDDGDSETDGEQNNKKGKH